MADEVRVCKLCGSRFEAWDLEHQEARYYGRGEPEVVWGRMVDRLSSMEVELVTLDGRVKHLLGSLGCVSSLVVSLKSLVDGIVVGMEKKNG